MDEPKAPETNRQVLPVRTRHELSERGTATELRVYCPFRDQSLPLDDCVECHHCDEILAGPDGVPTGVSCRRLSGPEGSGATALAWDPATAGRRALLDSVGRAMQPEFVTVTPETRVDTLADLLLDRELDAAVVVDSAGHVVGIVSTTHIFRGWRLRQSRIEGCGVENSAWPRADALVRDTVAELMVPLSFTVRESDSLTRVAALFAHEGVDHLPVVSRTNRLAGVVTAIGVLRWLARAEGYYVK